MADPRPHWYRITIVYCPACGSTKTYRERMYTERPENRMERIDVTEAWDYCGAF